jgi:hypothetical protein
VFQFYTVNWQLCQKHASLKKKKKEEEEKKKREREGRW